MQLKPLGFQSTNKENAVLPQDLQETRELTGTSCENSAEKEIGHFRNKTTNYNDNATGKYLPT